MHGVVVVHRLVLACLCWRAHAVRRNTILIYADDFGFDIGAFGSPTVTTPHLDRMAAEGVFCSFLVTASFSFYSFCQNFEVNLFKFLCIFLV